MKIFSKAPSFLRFGMPAMSDSPKFMGSELSSKLFWDQALPEYGFAMDRAIAPRPFELDELLRALCITKARRRPSGVIIAGDNPEVERTPVGDWRRLAESRRAAGGE